MTVRFYNFLFVCLAVIGMMGCTTSPPQGRVAVETFEHLQPVYLDVSRIEVQDQYALPMQAPHVEHNLVNPPYNAAFNMMRRAFQSDGANDILELNIVEASVLKTKVEDPSPSFKLWQKQYGRKYDGNLRVEIVLKRSVPPYEVIGQGNVSAKRELILPESMSLSEQEVAINSMTEKMITDLRKGLIAVLDEQFGLWPEGSLPR